MQESNRTSLLTSAELKHLFSSYTTGTFQSHQQSTEKTHYDSRHFCHYYLKANKVNKSKGTRKVETVYHFCKCTDAVCQKLSKLICTCRNYSLPKLGRCFETQGTYTYTPWQTCICISATILHSRHQ